MNGHFSEEALQRYAEMAAESQYVSFSEVDSYDFTRCVRPNGTAYGTAGKCRKGTEEEKEIILSTKPPKTKAAVKKTVKAKGKPVAKKQPKVNQKVKSDKPKKEALPPFTEKHKQTIQKWSESTHSAFWQKVNSCLRRPPECDKKEETAKFSEELKSALNSLPKNTKGETYYRGIDLDQNPEAYKRFGELKPGDKISDPGFNSYSRSRDTAESFSTFEGEWPSVMIISKSRKLTDISAHSLHADEEEALLMPNVSQTVKSVSRMNELIIIEVED